MVVMTGIVMVRLFVVIRGGMGLMFLSMANSCEGIWGKQDRKHKKNGHNRPDGDRPKDVSPDSYVYAHSSDIITRQKNMPH